MRTFFYTVIAGVLLFGSAAFAEGIKVTDSQGEYGTKIVTAQNVKGLNVRLSMEIIRNDCNRRIMDLTNVLVSGDGDGWYDRYFFDAHMKQTKMHCPLDKPVNETIYSKSVSIKSFTNENVKGKVVAIMVIPKGYTLEVSVME